MEIKDEDPEPLKKTNKPKKKVTGLPEIIISESFIA